MSDRALEESLLKRIAELSAVINASSNPSEQQVEGGWNHRQNWRRKNFQKPKKTKNKVMVDGWV